MNRNARTSIASVIALHVKTILTQNICTDRPTTHTHTIGERRILGVQLVILSVRGPGALPQVLEFRRLRRVSHVEIEELAVPPVARRLGLLEALRGQKGAEGAEGGRRSKKGRGGKRGRSKSDKRKECKRGRNE